MTDRESELVDCCPACGSASISHNAPGGMASQQDNPDENRCNKCHHTFDEPNRRERRGEGHMSGLTKLLDDAEPSEVFGNAE